MKLNNMKITDEKKAKSDKIHMLIVALRLGF